MNRPGWLSSLIIVGFAVIVALLCRAQGATMNEEEQAIRNVLKGTTEAFNKHDAKEFVRYYTSDAELVTVRGERMRGAVEIEKGLAGIFAARAKNATLKTLDLTIRFIRPDVAVAHVTNELSGNVDARGERLPSHRELSIRVMVKDGGMWRVTAFHNTILGASQAPSREKE